MAGQWHLQSLEIIPALVSLTYMETTTVINIHAISRCLGHISVINQALILLIFFSCSLVTLTHAEENQRSDKKETSIATNDNAEKGQSIDSEEKTKVTQETLADKASTPETKATVSNDKYAPLKEFLDHRTVSDQKINKFNEEINNLNRKYEALENRAVSDQKINELNEEINNLNRKYEVLEKKFIEQSKDTPKKGLDAWNYLQIIIISIFISILVNLVHAIKSRDISKNGTTETVYEQKKEIIQKENLENKPANNEEAANTLRDKEIEELSKKNKEQQQKIDELSTRCQQLETFIFPPEFFQGADTEPLRQHLCEWLEKQPETAGVICHSLGLFMRRASISDDSMYVHLSTLAEGISKTLVALKVSPEDAREEMRAWRDVLMTFANQSHDDFELRLPKLHEPVDSSYMSAKNKEITQVNRVITWAVFDKYRMRSNAQIE